MKFVHTLAAARGVEATTWAVADGLVRDFEEANVSSPTTLHFKEAAEKLEDAGYAYNPKTLVDYWRTASVFRGPKRRRSKVSVKVYEEILNPLWQRLDPETRSNDLVSYATTYFRTTPKISALSARAWAQAQGANLDAARVARQEAEAKAKLEERLGVEEAALNEALAVGDMGKARAILPTVNDIRRRLGLDLVKLDEEEQVTEPDPEATEEAKQETDEEKAKRLHDEATTFIEKAIANLGIQISYLGNAYLRYQEHLTEDDRDAYAEEIGLSEGRLALIRARFGGTVSDEALSAALAEWESEATS